MGHLDDIQTALKRLKKSEIIEINFMTILGLAESFKTLKIYISMASNAIIVVSTTIY